MCTDASNLSDAEYISKLETHLLAAINSGRIEVPDEVWKSGDVMEFCRAELAERPK
jgi:hypothetical protein